MLPWLALLVSFTVASHAALAAIFPGIGLAADCANTSTGFVPLTDLGAGYYLGAQGGLYPGGSNAPPSHHLNGGLFEAASVVPRDSAGQPDSASGRIVLLTIGMSNCSQESNAFILLAASDPLRDPRVAIVNGAQPNQSAEEIIDPSAPFWDVIDQRLADQGVSALQVQAVWFKETNEFPTEPFPLFPNLLRAEFAAIMQIIRDRFPNARLCYCSSRTYGGYASIDLNPEPYAYQSGFGVKWLIKDQIDGDPDLNYAPQEGAVEAPWLAWGPYLWADGLTPRSDGLIWECADFWEADGTHPSTSGENKVAQMLLAFFRTDPTASGWYIDDAMTGVAASEHDVRDDRSAAQAAIIVHAPYPNPFNPSVGVPIDLRDAARVRADVVSMAGRIVATLVDEEIAAGRHVLAWDGRDRSGAAAAAGTYMLRVVSDGAEMTPRKLTLLR